MQRPPGLIVAGIRGTLQRTVVALHARQKPRWPRPIPPPFTVQRERGALAGLCVSRSAQMAVTAAAGTMYGQSCPDNVRYGRGDPASEELEGTVDERTETRSERVDLRMTPAAKRTLQQAAAIANKTVTEFLLDTGLMAAFDTLADRRVFQLDEKSWDAFMDALAASPKDNPRLRTLLARKPKWEA